MRGYFNKIGDFLVADDGPTAVEYAVMIGLVIIVCIAAVAGFGTKTCALFTNTSSQLT
jgi:pilus assembly protein Flp/PilA